MARTSLERIDPEQLKSDDGIGHRTLELHLQRYRYASKWIQPGMVLDIACGLGYGTALLADTTATVEVIGVDIDAESIALAKNRYSNSRITFVESDAMTFVPATTVQTIVSLETLEHLPEPEKFIRHISHYLASGGRYIASVPITPSMDANPYHLHDFSATAFKKLFTSNGFEELDSFVQVQKFNPLNPGGKDLSKAGDLRKNIAGYYVQHPAKFFLRIKSILLDGFRNKYLVAVFQKK